MAKAMVLTPLPMVMRELVTQQWEWGEGVDSLLPAASLCGFLQHGANEDAVDAENRSPLHWAGVCGRGLVRNTDAGSIGWKGKGRPGLSADRVGGHGGQGLTRCPSLPVNPTIPQPSQPPLAVPQVCSCCVTTRPSWTSWIT